ncbi:MAG: flagellar biosynthesis anti-sigma factor FlgM [Candidatus Brocadia sp.]|nr:flagellar biosynthesis anti-sigma factor FlgM [Candidatus Brocadia sp.]NUO07122.1 flagellar biosynthesis anti-sigma factor FlgM [Candidatus Brocadia sp.]
MPIEDISKISLHHGVTNTNRIGENQPHMKIKENERLIQRELDSVDISKEARDLEQTISTMKARIREMPDVMAAKMEEIKVKLKDGFYDRPEVIEQVAKKVIDAFSIKK